MRHGGPVQIVSKYRSSLIPGTVLREYGRVLRGYFIAT